MFFSVKRNVENRWLPEPGGKKRAKISQNLTKKFWMRIRIKNQIFNGGCAKEPPIMMRKRKMQRELLKRKPERREGGKFHLLIEINAKIFLKINYAFVLILSSKLSGFEISNYITLIFLSLSEFSNEHE